MTAEEIEDLAYQNRGMPNGLNAAEQMLFQSFRKLYAYARLVNMSPEEGKAEKADLLREFQKRNFQVRGMEKSDRMWKEIEAAATKFAQERTVESAELFYNSVYGSELLSVEELKKRNG